jgi:hypothetical protein
MAEAESKGKQTQSHLIRLRNIPFPYRQRRRHNKAGVKEDLGQYDEGVLRTSSFETAKKKDMRWES